MVESQDEEGNQGANRSWTTPRGHKELFNNRMAPPVQQDLSQRATASSIKQREGESKTPLTEGSNPKDINIWTGRI